jgi:hypothetical protein
MGQQQHSTKGQLSWSKFHCDTDVLSTRNLPIRFQSQAISPTEQIRNTGLNQRRKQSKNSTTRMGRRPRAAPSPPQPHYDAPAPRLGPLLHALRACAHSASWLRPPLRVALAHIRRRLCSPSAMESRVRVENFTRVGAIENDLCLFGQDAKGENKFVLVLLNLILG